MIERRKHVQISMDRTAARLIGIAVAAIVLLYLAGCAALEPNAIRVYGEHVSHATQHAPFTSHPTNYGFNSVNIELHWQRGPVFLDVAEGVNLDRKYAQSYGGLDGPREVFTARAGYEWRIK